MIKYNVNAIIPKNAKTTIKTDTDLLFTFLFTKTTSGCKMKSKMELSFLKEI